MTIQYEQGVLDTHASEISSLAQRTTAAVAAAKDIQLGEASYGKIVGPLASPIARMLIAGFAETCDALADAVGGSAEGMQCTADAYRATEDNNVGLAKGMVR